jgi:hypothetical protein
MSHCDRNTPLHELGALWQTMLRALFDPYQPELHYMRGPGPKCRELALQGSIAPYHRSSRAN